MNKIYTVSLILSFFFCMPVDAQRRQPAAGNAPSGSQNAPTRQQPTGSQPRASQSAQNRQRPVDSGQSVAPRDRVMYYPHYFKQEGDSLILDMDIDMTRMELPTNHAQILTPVISSELEEIELPKVMIQGMARHKAFVRELELDDAAYEEYESNLPYAIVQPMGRLNYRMSVPFEPWMLDAVLDVEEDLCGCGDQAKIAHTRVMDGLTKEVIDIPVYIPRPRMVYIQPEVEAIKKRREIENAYLDFPRGKNDILPNFGNNAIELAKIDKMIHTVSTNKDITVMGVQMVGYASPESSVKFNTELSRARSEALMRYFMNNSQIPSSLFETRTGGEDWEGLRRLLEDYPLPNKGEIYRVMNTVVDLDAREKAMSKVAGGRPWRIIYDELFPKLRRVVCEIDYTVKDFSLEEAKENIKYAPQLLSLNEMYIVANTYEVGSPEFLKVFEVAREEFPEDPVANLNGAAVALSQGKLKEADAYLKLSDPSTPEFANNMGAFLLLRGNYKDAEVYLKRAENAGIPEATYNLRELRKKLENMNSRRAGGINEEEDELDDRTPTPTERRRIQ